MKHFSVTIFLLLLNQSLSKEVDDLPRKNNLVSNYLIKVLDRLPNKVISLPEINLGESTGRITDVEGRILGELEKQVDGIKSYGFTLDTNITKIQVKGYYDILYLDIPELFPVFGKGNFSIEVEALNLNMNLNAAFNAAKEQFDISIPKFGICVNDTTVKFENLMNDPSVADFLNELISNLIPNLVTVFTEPCLKLMEPFVSYYGNGIINCIKRESLTGKVDECIEKLFQTKNMVIWLRNEKYGFFLKRSMDLIRNR